MLPLWSLSTRHCRWRSLTFPVTLASSAVVIFRLSSLLIMYIGECGSTIVLESNFFLSSKLTQVLNFSCFNFCRTLNTFYFLPYEHHHLNSNPYINFCLLSFPRHTLEALRAILLYSKVLFVKATFHLSFPLVLRVYCSSDTSLINIFLLFSMSILVYEGKIVLIELSTHFCALPPVVPYDFSWLTPCESLLCLSVEMRCIVLPCFASPTIPFLLTFPISTVSDGKSCRQLRPQHVKQH